MKLIKFALLSFVVLFLVLTGLSMLFPSHLRVSRVTNLSAPHNKVVATISDFRTWKQWNRFLHGNTLTNVRYSDPSAGKGAVLTSDELTVRETASDPDRVDLHWELKGGKEIDGGFRFATLNADSLTVMWYFDLHFRWYPWEKLGVFVYDRKLGPAMEESLAGLKQFLEKAP
ncbi:MAG TPA: SRPBCC family protein [Puia sp.]